MFKYVYDVWNEDNIKEFLLLLEYTWIEWVEESSSGVQLYNIVGANFVLIKLNP